MKLIKGTTRYYITLDGNVINKDTGRIMKPEITPKGYYRISIVLSDGSKIKAFIHKLVAQAYIDNPLNKPQVNHKDQNKANNHRNNLEWVTNQENMIHYASHNGNRYKSQSEQRKGIKTAKIKPVIQRAINGDFIKRFNSVKQAKKETNINISGCLSGRYKTAGGFKWEFTTFL